MSARAAKQSPSPWPPSTRALRIWVVLCTVLVGCHREPDRVAGAGPPTVEESTIRASDEIEPQATLEPYPGTAFVRSLKRTEVHRYLLPVEAGSVVEFSIEQRGVDLEVAVFSGDGRPALRLNRALGGKGVEHAVLFSEADATYSLDLIGLATSAADSSYRLNIDAARPATPADRRPAAAETSFAEAEHLAESLHKESCRSAVPRYLAALELVQDLGDRAREAEVFQQLGWVHRKCLEEKRAALDYYSLALKILEHQPTSRRQSSILNNIGRMHHELGEMELAVESWRRALPLKRELGDRQGEASTLSNLGMASRYLGNLQDALAFYDQSLDVLREAGARLLEGRALNNRGRFYETLGKPDQALVDLEGALAIAEEIDDRPLQAIALTAIGRIRERHGEPAEALSILSRAHELRLEVGSDRGRAVTMVALASAHEALGDARRALDLNQQALALFTQLEAPRDEAMALTAIARLSSTQGLLDETVEKLDRALRLFRRVHDVHGEIEALFALAAAERERDRPEKGLELMETALERVEGVRTRAEVFDLSSRYLAQRQSDYDDYIDLLMDLHRTNPGAGFDARALEANERSLARALVDLLVSNRDLLRRDLPTELLEREREIEQQLASLERQRLAMHASPRTAARTEALEMRLDETLRTYHSLQARIRAQSPRYARLVEPSILSLEQIQEDILDGDTLLLEIRLGPERSHLWAVTSRSMTTFELPARSEIEDLAGRLYGLLKQSGRREFRGQTELTLEDLGNLLLGPVADEISRHQRLLMVTDGALRYIPIGALPVPAASTLAPGTSNKIPLLAEHAIISLPSASALAALREVTIGREHAPGLLAVLADPVFDASDPRLDSVLEQPTDSTPAEAHPAMKRLLYSRREAEGIFELADPAASSMALGFAATREAAMSPDLGRYRIIHIATHGELEAERPELSRLVFSTFDERGRPREGVVYAHEVYDLDLPAELVVLSACETALGTEIRGEGLVGLTHAFLQAGVERVLVSAWRVDDRATAELMLRFYRHLLEDRLRPAEALRRAQMSIRETPGWQAPYYWAGFVLQGEWR
ncbi:MAG: CHAT domain-containing protein [Thermoanaerobaculia bacterium]